jgi:hypothetical protein
VSPELKIMVIRQAVNTVEIADAMRESVTELLAELHYVTEADFASRGLAVEGWTFEEACQAVSVYNTFCSSARSLQGIRQRRAERDAAPKK